MKRNKINFLTLISELENDIEILDELIDKYNLLNKKIKHITPDEFDWAALGYVIHNLYNLLENYFLRTAKFFENDLDKVSWHKDLVDRMTIEIKGVRPRLFNRLYAHQINELRAFRHVFRYIYQSELDIKKLKVLNKKIHGIMNEFKKHHRVFIKNIQTIIEHL